MDTKPLYLKISETDPDHLPYLIQKAINIEVMQLNTYLYTYYSIKASWKKGKINEEDKEEVKIGDSGATRLNTMEGLRAYIKAHNKVCLSDKRTNEMVEDVIEFAHQASKLTSLAIGKNLQRIIMLSNIKQSMSRPPDIINEMSDLQPQHNQFTTGSMINRATFSSDQIKVFINFHHRETRKDQDGKKDMTSAETAKIELYRQLLDMIATSPSDDFFIDKPQILRGSNTKECDQQDTWHVFDKLSAETILVKLLMREGKKFRTVKEGNTGTCFRSTTGSSSPKSPASELSGSQGFKQLLSKSEQLTKKFGLSGLDFYSLFVRNVSENLRLQPSVKDKADVATFEGTSNAALHALSTLINAIYTYLLLLLESSYYHDQHTQFELLFPKIKRQTIYPLHRLCQLLIQWDQKKIKKAHDIGPTFEIYDFGQSKKSVRHQILDLISQLPKNQEAVEIEWLAKYARNFPNISWTHHGKTDRRHSR